MEPVRKDGQYTPRAKAGTAPVPPTVLTREEKKEKAREWRWWKINPEKLTKLTQAFAIGCTDEEATLYAGITERQLYYYQRLNPEFVTEKASLKQSVVLNAKQTVANTVTESYSNAMDYLKRVRRKEYGDNVDLTSLGEKTGSAEVANALREILTSNAKPSHEQTPDNGATKGSGASDSPDVLQE
jgi:hypothetical protein